MVMFTTSFTFAYVRNACDISRNRALAEGKKKANIVITASIGLITPGVVEWEVENPAYHILTNLSLW